MLVRSLLKRRLTAALGVGSAIAIVLISLVGTATAQQVSPPSGWPVLQLANPSPGTLVSAGDYVISGTAFDPAATEGSGVNHVDIFLGPRDEGGVFLGSAVPGQDMMDGLTPGSTAAQQSFQVTVTLPTDIIGGRDLFAYAYSSLTGAVTDVSIPIYVASVPTNLPTPAAPPAVEVRHIGAPVSGGTAAFSLGNPNAGDVVLYGDYQVSGTTGAGIDRVTLFLDDRDSGGVQLGEATPANGTFNATVKMPTSVAGGHNFTAYAYSSSTGQETKVSVPIYVGAAPTPTPRPS